MGSDVMRQRDPTRAFNRIPQPLLIRFVPDIAPEFIGFGPNLNLNPGPGTPFQELGIGGVDLRRSFFSRPQ
ncbi:hypothetical protein U27_06611 [Candidatus Vecturithrix granuli]|uniref:Uncharacterized protein n=1 Tax=Vecturithrix granuli TaxID=1499967 RepID=A0A081C4X1_VECG1|nr:hypothetical protein U27_06611 [Candidatus Vecturithrix granuli]